MLYAKLFEIGSVVFEMTLKVVNVLIFIIYVKLIDDNVPLEKDTAFHLKQSWIPFIQEGFVVKLVQWFWSFLKVLHLFSLCRYYLPFEKGYDIWTNLNWFACKLEMLCVKFGCNLPHKF